MKHLRRFSAGIAVVLALNGCGGRASISIDAIPELNEVTSDAVAAQLLASEQPVVLNVWASWCIPCRSEAPLVDAASLQFGDDVLFLGLNVQDNQTGARSFIAEFLADSSMTHLHDPAGDIPIALGANRAVPLTLFFHAGGELFDIHTGVLDERTLALQIDELLKAE